MKKSSSILSILLTLIVTITWFTGSWWYYTCKIKNTCEAVANPKPQLANDTETSKIINSHVIDTDGDGLSDEQENQLGSDPLLQDTDSDGIPDNQEVGKTITSPLDTDEDGIIDVLDMDDDNDGLSTLIEGDIGTSPLLPDSDGDGILDIDEVGKNTQSPIDTDGDGIINALDTDDDDDGIDTSDELLLGTNLLLADTDGDGVLDRDEIGPSLENPLDHDKDGIIDALDTEDDLDQDNDGLTNIQEAKLNTNPNKSDTDGDGINDLIEVGQNINSPLDSDHDGIIDALDTVNDSDSDGDGLTDAQEEKLASDPQNIDSDNDGFNDIEEIGSDINNPLDTDQDGILNIIDDDDDDDGLKTKYEYQIGTNPLSQDTDHDGLNDLKETNLGKVLDTDNDGSINAVDNDDDDDKLPTNIEIAIGTNPLLSDTDKDGISDYEEVGLDFDHPLDSDKNGIIDALQSITSITSLAQSDTKKSTVESTTDAKSLPKVKVKTKPEAEVKPQPKSPKKYDTTVTIEFLSMTNQPIRPSRIYFPFNLSELQLTPNVTKYFSEVATWLKQSKANTIVLTGHTDNIGSEASNLAMGIRRVMMIREKLISQGAPYNQIEVISKGESQPIAPNRTKEGRYRNRRVELIPSDTNNTDE